MGSREPVDGGAGTLRCWRRNVGLRWENGLLLTALCVRQTVTTILPNCSFVSR